MTSELHTMNGARMRSFVLPREHGAWGILLVPLVTGGWIGYEGGARIAPLLLFALAALALFCLRTPAEIWLETSPLRAQTASEKRTVLLSIAVYASLAGSALLVLIWRERAILLMVLGGAVAALFLAQAVLKKSSRRNRMAAQLVGALGLTSTAAGAYYVVKGNLDAAALLIWGLNWLFAANQIHFVQLRIRAARAATRAEKLTEGDGFLAGEAATVLILLFAWHLGGLPGAAAWALGPVLARGLVWFFRRPAPLGIHRLGFSELAHALIFGALLILGFHL
ncbi:MAG: YwiC-like family protein [Acidobacteria bacterium]|nr:YwiC-like family protein [Acidobacteriota bacterium]